MDRNNGGDPLAPPPPRPPKPQQQQPRVHQQHHQQPSSSSIQHRPRAPEPLPNMNQEEFERSPSQPQPPPRPPTVAAAAPVAAQPQEPVLPLPPRAPLKPTVLHAVHVTATAQPSPSSAQGAATPPTAPLVPLQQQQQQQQPSITFGRRQARGAATASPSPSSTFTNSQAPARAVSPAAAAAAQPTPIISTLTRNITNLGSNLSSLVGGQSAAAAQDAVTLAVPRPENERLTNEYVDTPFLQQRPGGGAVSAAASAAQQQQQQHSTTTPQPSLRQTSSHHQHQHHLLHASRTQHVVTSQPTAASGHGPTARLLSDPAAGLGSPHGPRKQLLARHAAVDAAQVVTKQPQKAAAGGAAGKKDLDAALHSIDKLDRAEMSAQLIDGGVMGGAAPGHGLVQGSGEPSITCPLCDKCKCAGCQRPRQLPSRWLCDKSCLCSAESVLDYATCLCCVKALFYHCAKDHEIDNENGNSISCADDPCSCLPHRRTARWGCLGALSIFLPCLACYWPMRGCISTCAACYACLGPTGCRCEEKAARRARKQHPQQMPLQHQQFGRDGPLRASMGRGGGAALGGGGVGVGVAGGVGGGVTLNGHGVFPGGAKKVFPATAELGKLRQLEEESGLKHVDCDMAREEDRLTTTTTMVCGGGAVPVAGGRTTNSAGVVVDSADSNLVRTLRLKPNSTSSTSSSQLSLLRHPADETPPRHLLD